MEQRVKLGASAWKCIKSIGTLPSNCTSNFISVSDCIKHSSSYLSVKNISNLDVWAFHASLFVLHHLLIQL